MLMNSECLFLEYLIALVYAYEQMLICFICPYLQGISLSELNNFLEICISL